MAENGTKSVRLAPFRMGVKLKGRKVGDARLPPNGVAVAGGVNVGKEVWEAWGTTVCVRVGVIVGIGPFLPQEDNAMAKTNMLKNKSIWEG